MSRIDVIEEEFVIEDLESELEQEREAAQDLKSVEDAAKKEAEASAAKADKHGDEHASTEAASAAFDFDQAERATDELEQRVEQEEEPRDSQPQEFFTGVVAEVRQAFDSRKTAKAEREVAERTGNADLANKAAKREAAQEHHEGSLMDSMKESLGSAADAVKSAAMNAKEQAKEAAEGMKKK